MKSISLTEHQFFITWYTAMAQTVRYCNRRFHMETELGLTQARVLVFLAANPGARMSSIADSLLLRRSTVSAAVDTMVSLGLIERRRDEGDSRIIHGSLTKKGQQVLPQYLELWADIHRVSDGWFVPGMLPKLQGFFVVEPGEADLDAFWMKPVLGKDAFASVLAQQDLPDARPGLADFLAHMEKIICVYNRIQFVAKAYNLGTNLGLILCYLDFAGGQTPLGNVRNSLRLESGELTVCLDKLQRKGYIKRIIDKKDRRRVYVRATKSGKLLNEQSSVESYGIFSTAFPGLSAEDPAAYLVIPEA